MMHVSEGISVFFNLLSLCLTMRITLALVCVLVLSGLVCAADCSSASFKEGCACARSGGSNCWESSKSSGMSCMAGAYPLAVGKYWMGDCKSLEKCVNGLQGCINTYCVGDDETKCSTLSCSNCYIQADKCADGAASCNDCGDGTCSEGETQANCCTDCRCPSEGDRCVPSKSFFSGPYCEAQGDPVPFHCYPIFLFLPLASVVGLISGKKLGLL
jgi:hypothetical protein